MLSLAVRTGVDLVRVDEFKLSRERAGDAFDRRLFTPEELEGADDLRLAGAFAAKEAAFKALGLPKGQWHSVQVVREPTGRPALRFSDGFDSSHVLSCDVSISHTGDYVVAVVTALVRT
ncbi:MAG: 4'-phosphopantetheinyl transferase superfamily protein [Chloroflexi bacterium]|nr:4'-phosphopantetheinyl transferase superfamily protein [Chloroflexota bacterium]